MSDKTNEHVPNFVISKQEASGVIAERLRFYPEDAEKLKELRELSCDEFIKYRSALIEARRYIFENGEAGQKKWRKALSASGITLRTEEVAGIKWTYTVKNCAASIGDGFGVAIPPSTSGAITIPSKLGLFGMCPVTGIGDSAFSWCQGLTDVKIPDSVTRIEDYAFVRCEGLTNVTIPANVTSIGDKAFSCCSRLTSLTIPDGVTYVGSEAFSYCYSLADVSIPGSLTKLEHGIFTECQALSNVNIAEGVIDIDSFAFWKCNSLRSVTIPASVKHIGRCAFCDCNGLKSVTLLGGVDFRETNPFDGCEIIRK